MRAEEILKRIFNQHVPEAAKEYCFQLWKEHPFHFKVTSDRKSKFGDFRIDTIKREPQITVNGGLSPFQFLITYVHEVAHWRVFIDYEGRVDPHGMQWKAEFRRLLSPVMNADCFPADILRPLKIHMRNPKAAASSDPRLILALSKFDPREKGVYLYEIKPGDEFRLRGRNFKKEVVRRTRSLCVDLGNQRKYLIPEIARVEPILVK